MIPGCYLLASKLGGELSDEGGGGSAAGQVGHRRSGVRHHAGRGRGAVICGGFPVSKLSAVKRGAAGGATGEAGPVGCGAAAAGAEGRRR